ncbi:MAG: hypothetical protein ACYCZN_16290, partial [Candidatus Dormibacteria bacterium]
VAAAVLRRLGAAVAAAVLRRLGAAVAAAVLRRLGAAVLAVVRRARVTGLVRRPELRGVAAERVVLLRAVTRTAVAPRVMAASSLRSISPRRFSSDFS